MTLRMAGLALSAVLKKGVLQHEEYQRMVCLSVM